MQVEGRFEWVTEEPLDFTNWAADQPEAEKLLLGGKYGEAAEILAPLAEKKEPAASKNACCSGAMRCRICRPLRMTFS